MFSKGKFPAPTHDFVGKWFRQIVPVGDDLDFKSFQLARVNHFRITHRSCISTENNFVYSESASSETLALKRKKRSLEMSIEKNALGEKCKSKSEKLIFSNSILRLVKTFTSLFFITKLFFAFFVTLWSRMFRKLADLSHFAIDKKQRRTITLVDSF